NISVFSKNKRKVYKKVIYMEFKEFLNVVKDKLPDYLLQYDIEDIHVNTVSKNNGRKFTGIAIAVRDEQISPNIYMDYYYMLYSAGKDMNHILELIAEEYIKARENIDGYDFKCIDNMDIQNNIFLKLINFEKNQEILADCPYIKYEDLAITFRILLKSDDSGIASACMRNKEFDKLNMDIDSLYNIAKDNTRKLFPPVLQRLDKMIFDKYSDICEPPQGMDLYVLTNNQGINGAVYMSYEDIISDFAKEHGSFYILPSSIHEVILFPREQDEAREELSEMVMEINRYVVTDTEYLSDSVYFYDSDMGQIVA
ncbi:MAG: hypothetical protein K2H07_04070, partial [Lachnospiraceae bacterium]|nr:hypothetical protein [Lachnospiraceae bacterium]